MANAKTVAKKTVATSKAKKTKASNSKALATESTYTPIPSITANRRTAALARKTDAAKQLYRGVNVRPIRERMTAAEQIKMAAELADLPVSKVHEIMGYMEDIAAGHLHKSGVGHVHYAGIIRLDRKVKPARRPCKGINPRTGEMMTYAAKPKTAVTKARALGKLKRIVSA